MECWAGDCSWHNSNIPRFHHSSLFILFAFARFTCIWSRLPRQRRSGKAPHTLRNSALKSNVVGMNAVRIETTVDERGEVHLTKLPFPAGESVEVIVVPKSARQQGKGFPLRGIPIAYDRPTDPVAEED